MRNYLSALRLLFDILAFSAFVGAVIGVAIFFAKTIASMAP